MKKTIFLSIICSLFFACGQTQEDICQNEYLGCLSFDGACEPEWETCRENHNDFCAAEYRKCLEM